MVDTAPVLQQLEHAILYGDFDAVVSLLDSDPTLVNCRFVSNLNLTPLMWACRNRRESIVAELLRRGADVNLTNRVESNGEGGNTALWFTGQGASEGTTGIAERLLQAGAVVNFLCERETTAVYIAADWVHLDLVQLLVRHGGDVTLPDAKGRTAVNQLREAMAWCGQQPKLNFDQQKFYTRAPLVLRYLEQAGSLVR